MATWWGGLLLIGDVNKMQVYRLAEYVNRRAGKELIPPEVMNRAPSAELAPGQEDPFDYPVVSPLIDDLIARVAPGDIMNRFRRGELGSNYPEDIYRRHDEKTFGEVIGDTYRRYQKSAFKRAQASPTVIVSGRALGFDLRETIINHWQPEWGHS